MATRDTQDRILDAAERLFAQRGFAGTSLRAVTSEAGVNLAAVNYHFGSKEKLLSATLNRLVGPINEERLRRLDRLEAASDPPSVEMILDAFLRPALEADPATMRVVAVVLYSESAELVGDLIRELFGEYAQRFMRALARALPRLGDLEIALRFYLMVGSMTHVLSGRPVLSPEVEPLSEPPSRARVLEEMIATLAAGFRAPQVEKPARESEDAA
jgi:AcrR family transcriptional regulator